VRLDRAIDLYLGDLARQGKSPKTLGTYSVRLMPLCGPKQLVEPPDARDVTTDHCRVYLDNWRDSAPGTRYHAWAVLSGFFKWLYRAELIDVNPMARIEPPKRLAPEELDVVTLRGSDVRRMFDVCETWGELLCLATLAYLGPRRGAASQLRWRDIDYERGLIRFGEKGGKVIRKPLPDEYGRSSGPRSCQARSHASGRTTSSRCSASRSMAVTGTTVSSRGT